MDKDYHSERRKFSNPLAAIQAAVDLLSRDPDNREKIKLVCKILNEQTLALSREIEEEFAEKLALS